MYIVWGLVWVCWCYLAGYCEFIDKTCQSRRKQLHTRVARPLSRWFSWDLGLKHWGLKKGLRAVQLKPAGRMH